MNNEIQICALCEAGNLTEFQYSEAVTIRGEATEVQGLRAFRCDACGEVTTSFAQLKENSKLIAAAKAEAVEDARRKKGLLVAEQVKQVRELLGLTQLEAARVFGGGDNIFSKYERGEVKQTKPMDQLLRLSIEVPDAAAWLMQSAGLAGKVLLTCNGLVSLSSLPWQRVNVCLAKLPWQEVEVHQHPMHGPAPVLEEDLFDSPTWKDIPIERCVGWN